MEGIYSIPWCRVGDVVRGQPPKIRDLAHRADTGRRRNVGLGPLSGQSMAM